MIDPKNLPPDIVSAIRGQISKLREDAATASRAHGELSSRIVQWQATLRSHAHTMTHNLELANQMEAMFFPKEKADEPS